MNQLLLRHEGNDYQYKVVDPRLDIVENLLDIELTLAAKKTENEEIPEEILLRVTHLEMPDGESSIHLRASNDFAGTDYYERANAFVYTCFHHSHVSVWLDIESRTKKTLVAKIRLVTDDVDNYDETATDSLIFGHCKFKHGPTRNMWGP